MTGHVDLTKERFIAFPESSREGVVHLLNLVRLRERAAYSSGHNASEAEALQTCGRVSELVLARVGGKITWEVRFE